MGLINFRKSKRNIQVVNSSDPSWWQARHEEGDTIGLIPSQDLEERRKCFVEKPDMSTFTKWSSCCGGGVSEYVYVTTFGPFFNAYYVVSFSCLHYFISSL